MEHATWVSLGTPSTMLANNMRELYEELAHELSDAWNLVTIKPAEYTPLNYSPQQQSAGLWFSEGFTMFYADLLVRRAGLPVEDSTRIAHLQGLITRYYADTGNRVTPPGNVSLASNAQPGLLGDYNASVHLQGELLGAMLDFIIRDATDSQKTLDDVMRLMYKRFGGSKGFYAKDVEQAVADVCHSGEAHAFFEKYVYQGSTVDFNAYLHLAGLQANVHYAQALNEKGQPAPDARVYTWLPVTDTVYRIWVTNPASCWAKAGMHTGDVVLALNNKPVKTRQDFYAALNAVNIGDTVELATIRNGITTKVSVIITGYYKPDVEIAKISGSSLRQKELLQKWEIGK